MYLPADNLLVDKQNFPLPSKPVHAKDCGGEVVAAPLQTSGALLSSIRDTPRTQVRRYTVPRVPLRDPLGLCSILALHGDCRILARYDPTNPFHSRLLDAV